MWQVLCREPGALRHTVGTDSTKGQSGLLHLFLKKKEARPRRLGRGEKGDGFICFQRFPVLSILIWYKPEIYTKWLQLCQGSKIGCVDVSARWSRPLRLPRALRISFPPLVSLRSAEPWGVQLICMHAIHSLCFQAGTFSFPKQCPDCSKCADFHVCS